MGISFFATRNREQHRQIRGRVSGTYSMSAILAMEDLIGEVMDLNLAKLNKAAEGSKPIRLDQFVNYFTFDVVGQLAMGGPIGFLEQERDVDGIIQSIHDGFYMMSNMGTVPGQMYWMNNKVARYLVQNFGGARLNSFEVFLNWLDARIDERMRNGLEDRRFDMLQYFINGKDPSGDPVTKGEVMIEGVNILGAGADTTAISILAVLGNILQNPDAFQRLRKELDDAHERLNARSLPFRELDKLPYFSAVVRESTRLHPSITYQLPRVPPPGGINICGFHIPSSVSCGISPAAMNRSSSLFGEDACKWIPERWLPINDTAEEAKRLRTMEQSLTTVSPLALNNPCVNQIFCTDTTVKFGMGSRSCVGRNLALVEVYKYVATLVRHFDASIVNRDRPWVTKSQWFSFQRDFWIDLELRVDSKM
jgi:cytochrome P450